MKKNIKTSLLILLWCVALRIQSRRIERSSNEDTKLEPQKPRKGRAGDTIINLNVKEVNGNIHATEFNDFLGKQKSHQSTQSARCYDARDSDSINYPWNIKFTSIENPDFNCEGTLISKSTIFTSAQCLWPTINGIFPCDLKVEGINPRNNKKFKANIIGIFVNSKWNINNPSSNDAAIAVIDLEIENYPFCELTQVSDDVKNFLSGRGGHTNHISRGEIAISLSYKVSRPVTLTLTLDSRNSHDYSNVWQYACLGGEGIASKIKNTGLQIQTQIGCNCCTGRIGHCSYTECALSQPNDCFRQFHSISEELGKQDFARNYTKTWMTSAPDLSTHSDAVNNNIGTSFENEVCEVGQQIGTNRHSFSNQKSQIRTQVAIQVSTIDNKDSQIGTQVTKLDGKILNKISGIVEQYGLSNGLFDNDKSQIGTQHGAKDASVVNKASQIGSQIGYSSDNQLAYSTDDELVRDIVFDN